MITLLLGLTLEIQVLLEAKLIKDPALAARLGDCGRRRVQEGFTIDHHLRQVSGLVLKVIVEESSS